MSGLSRQMARNQQRAMEALMKRVSRKHLDVLQNIEFTLITARRRRQDVDDQVCHAAIQSTLTAQASAVEAVAELASDLADMRRLRSELKDQAWRDALRVVAWSITNHSDLRPGEIGYLTFAGQYLP